MSLLFYFNVLDRLFFSTLAGAVKKHRRLPGVKSRLTRLFNGTATPGCRRLDVVVFIDNSEEVNKDAKTLETSKLFLKELAPMFGNLDKNKDNTKPWYVFFGLFTK